MLNHLHRYIVSLILFAVLAFAACTKPDLDDKAVALSKEIVNEGLSDTNHALERVDSAEQVGLFTAVRANTVKAIIYANADRRRMAAYFAEKAIAAEAGHAVTTSEDSNLYCKARWILGNGAYADGEYGKSLAIAKEILAFVDDGTTPKDIEMKCRALMQMADCESKLGHIAESERLLLLYSLSVAFYMPTLAISNSVAFTALKSEGLDTVSNFPPIRVFGTIGFICAMWFVDFTGFQNTSDQFVVSGMLSLLLALYSLLFMPHCPTGQGGSKSLVESFGLKAFTLFKEKRMALFFIFSFLLGVSLQITNGYANTYIGSFEAIAGYEGLFFVKHSNLLISLSQISEAMCILLIPYFLKRYGIKVVMLIAMFAWVLRFAFFGAGDPGSGVWLFILSCIVYGVAFDFFNVSGGLFVDESVDPSLRSSAQGLFMMMTNGLGSTIGSLAAQAVINANVFSQPLAAQEAGWRTSWYIFAAYALIVALLFWMLFRYKHQPAK